MREIIRDITGSDPDNLLRQILFFGRSLPREEKSAVVAGVFVPMENVLYVSTSRRVDGETAGYGKWNHAEMEAMTLRGTLTPDDLVVTTLSPCVVPSNNRNHISCTELLVNAGITRVHCGMLDVRQVSSVEDYHRLGLSKLTLSTDHVLVDVCQGLSDYFNVRLVGQAKIEYLEDIYSRLC